MFVKTLKYDLLFSRDVFLSMAAGLVLSAAALRFIVPAQEPGIGFIVVIMLCGVLAIVQVMQFFQKNFFDNTGYLMLTLPQKRFHLLASKVIVSFIWLNFMMLVAVSASSIITASRFSLRGIINVANPRTATGLRNITDFLDVSIIAMFIILVFFLVITLANSSLWRRRVHGLIAVAAGMMYAWLCFVVYMVIGQRSSEFFRDEIGWPVRQYNAFGEYAGTEYFYGFSRAMGLNVGRIPIDGGPLYFDIFQWGAGFAFCVLTFLATCYLLKRRISL